MTYGENGHQLRSELTTLLRQHRIQQRRMIRHHDQRAHLAAPLRARHMRPAPNLEPVHPGRKPFGVANPIFIAP